MLLVREGRDGAVEGNNREVGVRLGLGLDQGDRGRNGVALVG